MAAIVSEFLIGIHLQATRPSAAHPEGIQREDYYLDFNNKGTKYNFSWVEAPQDSHGVALENSTLFGRVQLCQSRGKVTESFLKDRISCLRTKTVIREGRKEWIVFVHDGGSSEGFGTHYEKFSKKWNTSTLASLGDRKIRKKPRALKGKLLNVGNRFFAGPVAVPGVPDRRPLSSKNITGPALEVMAITRNETVFRGWKPRPQASSYSASPRDDQEKS